MEIISQNIGINVWNTKRNVRVCLFVFVITIRLLWFLLRQASGTMLVMALNELDVCVCVCVCVCVRARVRVWVCVKEKLLC